MDPYDSPLRSPIVLGGSGVVISRVLSPLIWVISIVTLLITTPEPPSSPNNPFPQSVLRTMQTTRRLHPRGSIDAAARSFRLGTQMIFLTQIQGHCFRFRGLGFRVHQIQQIRSVPQHSEACPNCRGRAGRVRCSGPEPHPSSQAQAVGTKPKAS